MASGRKKTRKIEHEDQCDGDRLPGSGGGAGLGRARRRLFSIPGVELHDQREPLGRHRLHDRRRGLPSHSDLAATLSPPLPSVSTLETTVPVMSGKRAFLDLLKQEGVGIMFGNPGTTELPLMDAFAVENEIRYILGLQEAALMAMADGYAQASGKLTVLNLHVAPGLGNAMGMLYDAQMAGSPILVTAGQQDTEYLVQEPILSADLATLARPFVKFSAQVERLNDLPTLVHRAAKTALAPPTGPVFL